MNPSVVKLFRLMGAFGISLFSVLIETDQEIRALVAWPEDCVGGLPRDSEDAQEISWDVRTVTDDALTVAELAFKREWVFGGRIRVGPDTLESALGWTHGRFEQAMRELLSIRVAMVDEGEKTDSFFFEFVQCGDD